MVSDPRNDPGVACQITFQRVHTLPIHPASPRRRTFGRKAVALGAVLAASTGACRTARPSQPAGAPPALAPLHVVVVSVDGLRPGAIAAAGAATLQRLAREGASATAARTIVPSLTLPSHTSMLTGVGPEDHGVTWNDNSAASQADTLSTVRVTTAFAEAHAAGLRTAAFFGKTKLRYLVRPGSVDLATYPTRAYARLSGQVVRDAAAYMESARPHFTFLHFAEPDLAGHTAGWMTRPYQYAVRRADAAVREAWDAARAAFGDRLVFIVTADHGGHARTHGSDRPVDVRIPWIAWGRAVTPGAITTPVITYDTAATVLWLLGVPQPAAWDGRPVTAAFTPSVPAPATAPR